MSPIEPGAGHSPSPSFFVEDRRVRRQKISMLKAAMQAMIIGKMRRFKARF